MTDTSTEAHETGHAQRKLLIVEDESIFAKAVSKRLRRSGFDCVLADTLKQANQQIDKHAFDLILLDMRLPDGSGMTFLEDMQTRGLKIPVVVLTAYGGLEDAVEAMKLNALDYLKKPIDLDELVLTLDKVLTKVDLQQRLDYSQQRENRSIEHVQLIGESPSIIQVRQQIQRISELSAQAGNIPPTVLVLGETGSGKDVAARIIHLRSNRASRPFVHIDCASLPDDLIEAELFGHEKGAFTNAYTARTGLIEAAEDGTVFLDEIGELPLELQTKLLAVLERRSLRRLGSSRERNVDAWFIVGTNRPLADMVKEGRFRADLYYRLKVLTIVMPPLRERGNDIILLAQHFAEETARRYGQVAAQFTADAQNAMLSYHWPGNVRELMHLVERAVLLSGGEPITTSTLMLDPNQEIDDQDRSVELAGMTLDEAEKYLIRQALERTDGNVSEAARQLGVTRMVLRTRIQKHELQQPDLQVSDKGE